ncbi:MAG: SRPBCC family protein [Actinomycetota bacterium]
MARYLTRVQSPWSADRAFAYLADLRNFAEWDPGVTRSELVAGDGPGPDAAYAVTVAGVGRPLTLRYETTAYEPPSRIEVRAASSLLTSVDVVTVEPSGGGSLVTYDATLTLRGPARLGEPILALGFRRIGDRAAAGLRAALDGTAA